MTDIDKPVDAAPLEDNPVPQSPPVSSDVVEGYSPDLPPAGIEENVNVVAEDSEDSDFAKNQEPVYDDEPEVDDEDDTDDEQDSDGDSEGGA